MASSPRSASRTRSRAWRASYSLASKGSQDSVIARDRSCRRSSGGSDGQVGLARLVVGEELAHRSLVAYRALLEDVRAIAQLAHEADVLLGEHQREPARLQAHQLFA